MKIGLCGAQGTGKTTLSRALAQKLKLPLIKEQARVAAEYFGITRPSHDIQNRPEIGMAYELQCLVLQLQSEDQNKQGFVSDRTVMDIAVYWKKWLTFNSPATMNRFIFELCKHRAQKYDLVIYIPPEIPLENDQFRSTDPEYQAEMDFLARTVLKICKPPSLITVTGSVPERLDQVLSALKSNSREISTSIPSFQPDWSKSYIDTHYNY